MHALPTNWRSIEPGVTSTLNRMMSGYLPPAWRDARTETLRSLATTRIPPKRPRISPTPRQPRPLQAIWQRVCRPQGLSSAVGLRNKARRHRRASLGLGAKLPSAGQLSVPTNILEPSRILVGKLVGIPNPYFISLTSCLKCL